METIQSETAKKILARSYDGGHVCMENAIKAVEKAEEEMKEKAISAFSHFVKDYCSESGISFISNDSDHYLDVFKKELGLTNKEKILSFIKERSESELGTTKKLLYKEFKDVPKKEIDTIVKELNDEGEILLAPLYSELTGLLCGRGYLTPEIF